MFKIPMFAQVFIVFFEWMKKAPSFIRKKLIITNVSISKTSPVTQCALSLWIFLFISSIFSSISTAVAKESRNRVITEHGVVATDHGKCSTIGRDILQEGGNAVDAAVAATLCLGVVSPASSGIGGGAFMLVRSAHGKTEAYDMRETAPKLASKNMYAGNAALKASGALSIAVPGELAGLEKAWRKHGRVPWKKLVTPAAQLAKNGFKISPYLRMQMVSTESGIMRGEGLRGIFTSNGSLLQSGSICYNRQLAKTLARISNLERKRSTMDLSELVSLRMSRKLEGF